MTVVPEAEDKDGEEGDDAISGGNGHPEGSSVSFRRIYILQKIAKNLRGVYTSDHAVRNVAVAERSDLKIL